MSFQPTPQQVDFISDPATELVMIACPGSGKTHTAVMRFIERCRAKPDYGIALLSFTNTAVDEAHRIARENDAAGLIGHPNKIDTLDAFLQHYIFEPFIRAVVPAATLPIQIIEGGRVDPELTKDSQCKVRGITPNLPGKSYGTPVHAWDIRGYISLNGRFAFDYDAGRPNGWTVIEGTQEQKRAIGAAKRHCLELGYLTFNDILLYCRALLRKDELRIAEIIAARFREIIIDEAQDTSMLHQDIFRRVADAGAKISYVGDPKQGIYGFNFANARYIEELAVERHRRHVLTDNYRSIEPIVNVVNNRFGTNMRHKRERKHQLHGAYVFVGNETAALNAFECLLKATDIPAAKAAAIARNRTHLGKALRPTVTDGWRTPYKHALAAWQYERMHDVERALRAGVMLMRGVLNEESLKSVGDDGLKELAWEFIRERLPSPRNDETPADWANRIRVELSNYIEKRGFTRHGSFGNRLSTQNITGKGSALKKLSIERPALRSTVVHQVKGESISGVLVIAPPEQHETWLRQPTPDELEEYNICYVAFTRASDLLVLHCPTEDIAVQWRAYGFVNTPKVDQTATAVVG